jgi:hypothetical protein
MCSKVNGCVLSVLLVSMHRNPRRISAIVSPYLRGIVLISQGEIFPVSKNGSAQTTRP